LPEPHQNQTEKKCGNEARCNFEKHLNFS
jgi:hypothetical protein